MIQQNIFIVVIVNEEISFISNILITKSRNMYLKNAAFKHYPLYLMHLS